ncbi:MAG: hypothetical protein QM820_65565 [Minicystis sp.]
MNILRLLLLASSTIALLPACSSSSPSMPPPGGGGGGGSGGGGGGGQSTTELRASWKPTPGWALRALAAASTGKEAAVAYAEENAGGTQTVLKLQRLDGAGAVRGPAIDLGDTSLGVYDRLTLATDGDSYLACWGGDDVQITCAVAPVGEGPASAALSVAGAGPSLVYGSGSFALAYALPGQLAVTRVAGDGSAVGPTATFDAPAIEGMSGRALLAARKDGFVLAGGDNVRVHTLDSALSPVGDPIDLGVLLWMHAAIAASDTDAVVSLAKPYGGLVFVVADGAVKSPPELVGGYKGGLNTAVIADGDAYGFLSADDESGLHYSTIVHGSLIEAKETLVPEHGRFDQGYLALVRVQGETLFVATPGFENGIVVARVQRN